MKAGQLRYEDKGETDKIEDKMELVVLGVGAGQDEEDDGGDGQELAGRGVLDAVVNLLPVGQAAVGALVKGHPRVRFHLKQREKGPV